MTTPNESEEAKLLTEYQQLCEDWRSRDRYVVDKLGAAGILFGLLGVALGTIPSSAWLIKLILVLIGAFFSLLLSISIAKDTYYRDGTEKLLKRLSAKLSLNDSLQTLKALEGFNDGLDFSKLKFLRKIKIQPDKSSLVIRTWFRKWLRKWLLKQQTFSWILAFYLISFFIFVILFILILVDSLIWWLNLPI